MQTKNKAAFFIVTPSYNQAQFIEQTIHSVLAQKGDFDVHYFVADGGSSDGTKKILEKYSSQLAFVSKKDDGQAAAINSGISYFAKITKEYTEAYFAYINSDDYYETHAFQTVLEQFRRSPDREWLVGDAKIVDTTNREIQPLVRVYKKMLRMIYQPWMLLVLNPLPQPAIFLRWSAFTKMGIFDQSLHYTMDYEYWLRCQASFGAPIFCNRTLVAFRIHQESKGGSQFHQQFAEELAVAKRYTSSRVLLFLHRVHNKIITSMYSVIK